MKCSHCLSARGSAAARRRMFRPAFTLIELLVAIAVIGLLVGLLMPAVGAAREAARRTQCISRIRQLGMAVVQHEAAFNVFPPARLQARPGDRDQCGGQEATWLVRVLPYLEEDSAYHQWDLYQPWYKQSDAARRVSTHMFLCPSRRGLDESVVVREVAISSRKKMRAACGCTYWVSVDEGVEIEGVASDYAANHGDLSPGAFNEPTDFYYGGNGTGVLITSRPNCRGSEPISWLDRISAKDIRDGLSHTFLIGEKHIPLVEMGSFPADSPAFDGEYLPASSRLAGPGVPLARGMHDTETAGVSFGSWHADGACNFAMADGSVMTLANTTSTRILARYAHRNNSHLGDVASD